MIKYGKKSIRNLMNSELKEEKPLRERKASDT